MSAPASIAVYAAAKHLEWIEKERTGPNYYGLSRDTHPEGETIWRRWWEEQLELCAETERLCREVVELSRNASVTTGEHCNTDVIANAPTVSQ